MRRDTFWTWANPLWGWICTAALLFQSASVARMVGRVWIESNTASIVASILLLIMWTAPTILFAFQSLRITREYYRKDG